MVDKHANPDQVIARLAANQHGVVSTAQLVSAGLSRAAVAKRAQADRLHRLHRGVYAVGHTRLSFEGRCMAAVLALGDRVVLSHRSAAAVWHLISSSRGPIEVTLLGDSGCSARPGITIHRSVTLNDRLIRRRSGLPVTNPTRTLRDLRRTVPQRVFRAALRRALDLRLIRSEQVRDPDLTRSELERIFIGLCRRHHLPQPEVNARVGPYEVDFLWRDRGVIVETDGFRHHGHRDAFERDRARDAHLQCRGFRVLRFTHRQVVERTPVVAALRPLLAQRSLAPNL